MFGGWRRKLPGENSHGFFLCALHHRCGGGRQEGFGSTVFFIHPNHRSLFHETYSWTSGNRSNDQEDFNYHDEA